MSIKLAYYVLDYDNFLIVSATTLRMGSACSWSGITEPVSDNLGPIL
jgi:hypothetical protein